MSQNENNEINTKYMKKMQREMSKARQDQQKIESQDLNAFSDNSETEREKTSVRKPTGSDVREQKNYKRRKNVPSWQPLK
jgi:hypothetical protein